MALRNPNTPKIVNDINARNKEFKASKLPSALNNIADEVSEELNISKKEIVLMLKSIFHFTQYVLAKSISGEVQHIKNLVKVRWTYFGSFQISQFKTYKHFKGKETTTSLTNKRPNRNAKHNKIK